MRKRNFVRVAAVCSCWLAAFACSDDGGGDGDGNADGTPAGSQPTDGDLGFGDLTGTGNTGTGTTGTGTTGTGASGDVGGTDGTGAIPGGGVGTTTGTNFEGCVGQAVGTEALPLNLYIMFDQSCSMSCPIELTGPGNCCMGGPNPRIDLVREAVNDFLTDPGVSGLGAGIGYFGFQPSGNTSCNPNTYSDAAVPIGRLPQNADALVSSLNGVEPTGETPTNAAIAGACNYATGWLQDNPGNAIAILLVTDGFPEAPGSQNCNPTLNNSAQAAADCLDEGISTYVIGVGGELDNLNQLAESGGTGSAYLVSPNSEQVTDQVLDALSAIRQNAAVPCEFSIPPPPEGQSLDPSLVNVTYLDPTNTSSLIPNVGTEGNCGASGGWYYNNIASPSSVVLCDNSCNTVTAGIISGAILGQSGQLNLEFGCATVIR